MATLSGNTVRWPCQLDHVTDKLCRVAEELTGDVWAAQGSHEVIRSILCYLSNGMMSLKARVSVKKSRRDGSICVSGVQAKRI